jgi:hypothetical protein
MSEGKANDRSIPTPEGVGGTTASPAASVTTARPLRSHVDPFLFDREKLQPHRAQRQIANGTLALRPDKRSHHLS